MLMTEVTSKISSKMSCIFLQGTSGHQKPYPSQILEVANTLADLICEARKSLRIAIYDFRLGGEAADIVLGAIHRVGRRGVDVLIAYDAGGTPDKQETFAKQGGDPAPSGSVEFLGELDGMSNVRIEGIDGQQNLMHGKYVIRDAGTKQAKVWLGSANFTEEAWGRQENNVLILESPILAGHYQSGFLEMFAQRSIQCAGNVDSGETRLGDEDDTDVVVQFSPGPGRQIDSSIAETIRNATRRVRIASMLISSGSILGAILDAREAGADVHGIYDGTQMAAALKAIDRAGDREGKHALFEQATRGFAEKRSMPYSSQSVHDYMNNKIAVVDDMVITGSFNFSANATRNAENCIRVNSKRLADAYVAYIDKVIERYS